MFNWTKNEIVTSRGVVLAEEPVIVNFTRNTDGPAFYMPWFMNRLRAGYAVKINPFSHQQETVSFAKTRAFMFWTKNPEPMLPYIPRLQGTGKTLCVQFTLNDYEREGFEPGVPALEKRIEVFKQLSTALGRDNVMWRTDPLILTEDLGVAELLDRIERIGNAIHPFTRKLTFSFFHPAKRTRVKNKLKRKAINLRQISAAEEHAIAQGLASMNTRWGLDIGICSDKTDFSQYGISKNRCNDPDLFIRLAPNDRELVEFCSGDDDRQKDSGQRKLCGCIKSKDVGQGNSCLHGCVYCYANTSDRAAQENAPRHDPNGETLLP